MGIVIKNTLHCYKLDVHEEFRKMPLTEVLQLFQTSKREADKKLKEQELSKY